MPRASKPQQNCVRTVSRLRPHLMKHHHSVRRKAVFAHEIHDERARLYLMSDSYVADEVILEQ